MNFIKKSLWALFALVVLSYQPTQAMDYFSASNPPVKKLILKEALMLDRLQENKSFEDVCRNFSLVCKDWKKNISKNAKNWVCEYFNIEEKHKDNFWRYFTKGKLIYAKQASDNRQAFFFSAAPNPFKHTFDLSKCDDAGKYMSFHLGIPEKDKEFASKIQTWIFFSPDVENKLGTTAQHLKPIFPVKVPVGMLWTWGKCKQLDLFDHLTTKSPENLSKINIYENWVGSVRGESAGGSVMLRVLRCGPLVWVDAARLYVSSFVCELK